MWRRIMREKGWKIVNIDSTLLCQKPKLAPYIPAMRENLAAAFGMPVDAVSVKATTEEHLALPARAWALPPMLSP